MNMQDRMVFDNSVAIDDSRWIASILAFSRETIHFTR